MFTFRRKSFDMVIRMLLLTIATASRGCSALRFLRRPPLYHSGALRALSAGGPSSTLQTMSCLCRSSKEVEIIGHKLSTILDCGDVLFLQGDLGAGKTTLSRGIVRSKFQDSHMVVTSPSYLLDNTYQYEKGKYIHHMDLYRLPVGYTEMGILGIPAIFSTTLCIIEWPNRLVGGDIPESYLDVTILIPPATAADVDSKTAAVVYALDDESLSKQHETNTSTVNELTQQADRDTQTGGECESDQDGYDDEEDDCYDSDAEENNASETRLITFTLVGERWKGKAGALRSLFEEPEAVM